MPGRIKVAAPENRTYQGIVFASKHEMEQWINLVCLQRSGIIHDLQRQVPFELNVNGHKVCKYVADFTYREQDGTLHVCDAKGMRTEIYKLKKKLFAACFPSLTITEL